MSRAVMQQALPRGVKDRAGLKIGRLTVIRFSHLDKVAYWVCQCDCGTIVTVRGGSMQYGNTTSCGCYGKERRQTANTTHGMKNTATYRSWRNMRMRCNLSTCREFKHYGDRGISVCERWDSSFENFLVDMGECPNGMSIERIDNNKDYSKENCVWATQKDQIRNRRVTLKHAGEPIAAIAERIGEKYMTVYSRFKKYGTPYKEAT